MNRWAASAHGGVGKWWPCWRRSRKEGEGEVKGRRKERGGRKKVERIQPCTCNFPHLLHISFFARDSGESGRGVCRHAGREGTWWKHLRRGLGETWAPISLPSPTHQLRPHPAHFLLWPWSLAPRSFFIHINVEVSSHGAGLVCASTYCSLIYFLSFFFPLPFLGSSVACVDLRAEREREILWRAVEVY